MITTGNLCVLLTYRHVIPILHHRLHRWLRAYVQFTITHGIGLTRLVGRRVLEAGPPRGPARP